MTVLRQSLQHAVTGTSALRRTYMEKRNSNTPCSASAITTQACGLKNQVLTSRLQAGFEKQDRCADPTISKGLSQMNCTLVQTRKNSPSALTS